MTVPFLCLLALAGAQEKKFDLPEFQFRDVLQVGQREIVLGPALQKDVTMVVRKSKHLPGTFGQFQTYGPTDLTYSIGVVHWSVTEGTLRNKPCRIIKLEALTKDDRLGQSTILPYGVRNTKIYWISPEGKILRQFVRTGDPNGTKSADCTFLTDHIEDTVEENGVKHASRVFPNFDMSLLDAQFKPMLEGDKVILESKEYYEFEPFKQSFVKYKATASGRFHGNWNGTKFDGVHVDIQGPKALVVVFVSKEGDLVQVDFPKGESIDLNTIPDSKNPYFRKPEKG